MAGRWRTIRLRKLGPEAVPWRRNARLFAAKRPSSPCHGDLLGGAGMGSESLSDETPERRFRTLFISDVHLGARGSQADRLLDFLRTHVADTIYLVGDIV